MTVDMHGMRGRRGIVDYDANSAVGAEVVDVGDCWIGKVAGLCLEEGWSIVVCAERSAA